MPKSLEQMKQELDAYHGSPHRFPPTEKNPLGEFDPTKIGTGEGAQAYGYGHYLAEAPKTAKGYADQLGQFIDRIQTPEGDMSLEDALTKHHPLGSSMAKAVSKQRKKSGIDSFNQLIEDELIPEMRVSMKLPKERWGEVIGKRGHLYHVRIPHEHIEKMLDWDKPLSEQHPHVQQSIINIANGAEDGSPIHKAAQRDASGGELYKALQGRPEMNENREWVDDRKKASLALHEEDIPGIKYTDALSRMFGDAGKIVEKYGSRDAALDVAKQRLQSASMKDISYWDKIVSELQKPNTRNFVVFPGNEHIMKVVHREAKGGAIHEGNSVRVVRNNGGLAHMADGGQPFYSPVDQAISKLSQAKGTGDQYLSMIRNTHGVKPQEIEDRGLEQKMTGKMGLPDVQRIASENPTPKITESVAHQSDFYYAGKGADGKYYLHTDSGKPIAGPYDMAHDAESNIEKFQANKPQYAKYQLPGGKNYREIKIKLPTKDKDKFKSSHFKDETNVLAHARVSDRTGPNGEKILHVEEIQSDWHQMARDLRNEEIDRLVGDGMPLEEAKKLPANWGYVNAEDRKHIVGKLAREEPLTFEEEAKRQQLMKRRAVPDAPHKKDWHELVLKHLLDHAAKNGYDKMIITPGEEQAKRYDLSKHIGQIEYKHNPDKTVSLRATNKDDGLTAIHEEDLPHHKLHNYVGKEIAKKIMAGEGTPYKVSIPYEGGSMPITTPERHAGKMVLGNLDLKVGDEGMKGFYNDIIPSFLNKYGKKFGAKVGTYRMDDPNKDYNWSDYTPTIADMNRIGMERFGADRADMTSEQSAEAKEIHKKNVADRRAINLHSFDITPPMREEIVNKGQSRYNKGGSVKPIPAEAGSTPVKEGHVRLYHQTDGDNLRKIEKEGLLLKHAKGIEGPRAIYAGETPFYGSAKSRPTLEFQVPKEHWQSPFVLHDVAPKDIIAAHYPWHSHARYLESEDNKEAKENVLSGKHDNLGGDTGKAVQYIKEKYGVKKSNGGAVKTPSLDAMRYALMQKNKFSNGGREDLSKYKDPKSTKIADWKWRKLPAVAADINMQEVPDYIQKNYGDFMKQQLAKANAGDMTARDFIKAYGITQSSIGRQGLSYDTATKTGMKLPRQQSVRPEGAFSEWLGSKQGQNFLNAAEKGDVNEDSLKDMKEKFSPFSMTNALADKLKWAVEHSKSDPNLANLFSTMPLNDYRDMMMNIKGIGPAKSGFIGSLLGRGDLPTLDARQVLLHTGKYNKDPEFARRTSAVVKGKPVAGTEAVDRLIARQSAMGMDIDPTLEFFRQHLTHHAVWDKVGNTETTHGDVVKAMKNYNGGGDVKEPKSTVPAYKLFRVDKNQPGKLFPLFVDSKTPVEKDKWVKAKAGEMAGEKVKSKIGPLAYRPGWHAGDLPIATHIGEKSDSKLNKPDRRPHNQVWAEIDMANDVDWQKKANKRGMNKNGKLIAKNAHITDQVPKGGHYRYKTNPNMTGSWLIGGEMKVKRVLPDEEVRKINKKAKVKDLPREKPLNLKEWGFKNGGSMSLLQSKD